MECLIFLRILIYVIMIKLCPCKLYVCIYTFQYIKIMFMTFLECLPCMLRTVMCLGCSELAFLDSVVMILLKLFVIHIIFVLYTIQVCCKTLRCFKTMRKINYASRSKVDSITYFIGLVYSFSLYLSICYIDIIGL